MNRPLLIAAPIAGAATAALAIAAVTACTNPPAQTTPAAVASPATTAITETDLPPTAPDHTFIEHPPVTTLPARSAAIDNTETGSVEQLGLGYMQALQRGDWANATGYLTLFARRELQNYGGAEKMRAVGQDVLRNAGGHDLGPCTSAERVGRSAVVVTCGRVRVAVPVEPLKIWRGVKPSLRHASEIHVDGPHTHAYTTLLDR